MIASSRLALVVAAPPVSVALLWVTVLAIAGITGQHPIWSLVPRNLTEAVIFRDRAAVVRLLNRREDINREAEIRRGAGRFGGTAITPLEAAVESREREMVELVFALGATPSPAVWQRAFCLADSDTVRTLLSAHRPAGSAEECKAD